MTCPVCAMTNTADARICVRCGTTLPDTTVRPDEQAASNPAGTQPTDSWTGAAGMQPNSGGENPNEQQPGYPNEQQQPQQPGYPSGQQPPQQPDYGQGYGQQPG